MDDVLLDHPKPGVAVVTLNRPDVRNAAGTTTWPGLWDMLTSAEDADARAIVITGAGDSFCAGGDLKDPGPRGEGVLGATMRLGWAHDVLGRINHLPLPVIAAVEGPAVGVGWGLALACDLVVAARGAFFSAPFLDRGLVPDGGVVWHLARTVGTKRAADLALSGRQVTADEAMTLGLVSRVVGDGEALGAALADAETMVSKPADALRLTKRLLRTAATQDLATFLDSERHSVALNSHGPDPAEGRAAFREKRAPRFGLPRGQQ